MQKSQKICLNTFYCQFMFILTYIPFGPQDHNSTQIFPLDSEKCSNIVFGIFAHVYPVLSCEMATYKMCKNPKNMLEHFSPPKLFLLVYARLHLCNCMVQIISSQGNHGCFKTDVLIIVTCRRRLEAS